jgi:excisionase family DNA binding protein
MGALRRLRADSEPEPRTQTFLTIAEAAARVRISKMTLYRAIHDHEFPAVQIRSRFIVPAQVIDEMAAAAIATGQVVNAADWAQPAAIE